MATTIANAPNAVARLQERNDLAQLNDRLSHYITEVKHLREQAHRVDSTAFLESIKILEDGLYNLKNMYEHELDKARRYSDDLAQEKNHYAMQVSKHQNGLQELENRLADEMEKNRKAQDDMNVLHRSVAEKERQLEDIRHEVKEPLEELELLRRQYTDLLRENNNLKRKSETENYQRSEAEDKSDQMHKKMEFMETVHKQESQDLNDRLNVAQESILALEQRVRDLTRPDNLLEELVQRVRNSADHEMTMFREESEELFQRTVTALKARIDEDARRLEQLTGQNVQLTSEAGEMLSQIRALEGQVGSLDHQRRSLEEILYNERQHARSHITGLERKLQDLNDLLILKLRELNLARDAQVPLKSEVEALRVLLEEEERRLRNLPDISCGLNMPRTLQPLTTTTQTACTTAQAVPTTPLTASAYAAGVNIPNPTALGRRAPTQPQPPLGPVRARSAPVATPKLNLIPSTLGQGKDYFDQMFNDLRRDVIRSRQAFSADPPAGTASNANGGTSPFERPGNPEPGRAAPVSDRPPSSTTHDYNTSSCSATGPIRILEVQPDGKYVRMINTATTKDEEFGNFLLQQNVGGQPVAVYRFPPRLRFPAGATITVWSGSNDLMMHQPPSDYVFKEQTKWGTGPECTTILCKPSGQAVAWTTAAHRFSRDAFDQLSLNMTTDNTGSKADIMKCQEELPELSQDVNGPRAESVYLRREKEQPPCLSAQKHPHGVTPPSATHPNSAQARALTYGNDNSTVNRQSRSQTSVPDPIPGAPYAGASAQRMGSASLRKYSGTIKGNGHIANKKEAARPGTTTSRPPSSFQTPRDRFSAGLQQIQSQHNEAFTPPMPRPPLFSAW